MATYARKLKDGNGSYICPATRSDLVYFPDNTVLSKLTFYPVGSIYQSTSEESPASLFGGEWEAIVGRFLLGSSEAHAVNSWAGEEAHILTINEMPIHDHYYPPESLGGYWGYGGTNQNLMAGTNAWGQRTQSVYPQGGGQAHNNMPPFYTVNIWRRTA